MSSTITLEQEVASIIAFALREAGNPHPYYQELPEQFAFPAMYFPQPEIVTRGETFRTYASEYAWYINVFARTTEEAHSTCLKVLTRLKQSRNCIPILNADGSAAGKKLRLNDPSVKRVDTGVAQLTLSWISRRPYDLAEPVKMQSFHLNYTDNSMKEENQYGEEETGNEGAEAPVG